MKFILVILIFWILIFLISIYFKYFSIKYTFKGKLKKYVLTYNENMFFNQLQNIVKEYNCYIFPKMRIADIIEASGRDFYKICSKHIDYTICDKNFKPLLFIELDDYTHNFEKVIKRDIKKDIIFESINSNIIRVTKFNKNEMLLYIDNFLKKDPDKY